jgi:cytochrome c biogenesis protein CcmG/thiol:disulfide interchange protein DsbE
MGPSSRNSASVLIAIVALGAAVAVAYVALTARLVPAGVQPEPGSSPIIVGRSPLLDRPAPDFALTDLDGRTVRLADYRGRPVLLYFWASWCIPCRTEFPVLAEAQKAHAVERLQILGVVYKDAAGPAREFMAAHGGTWPALLDPDGAAARAYIVHGAPTSYYVDRDGIVRAVSYGPAPRDVLEDQLRKIL